MIKIPGTVNDSVDLDGTLPEAVEYKVRFQNNDPIPSTPEDCISRYAPKPRVAAQPTNPAIEFFDETSCSAWIVLRMKSRIFSRSSWAAGK